MQKSKLINQKNLPTTPGKSKENFISSLKVKKHQKTDDEETDQLIVSVTECLSSSTSLLAYDILKKCLSKLKKIKQKQNHIEISMTESYKMSGSRKLQSLTKSSNYAEDKLVNKDNVSYRIKKPIQIHPVNSKKTQQSYIENNQSTISENLFNQNQNLRTKPYTNEDIDQLKQEIKRLKEENVAKQNEKVNIQINYDIKLEQKEQSQQNENQAILKSEIQKLQNQQICLWMYINANR